MWGLNCHESYMEALEMRLESVSGHVMMKMATMKRCSRVKGWYGRKGQKYVQGRQEGWLSCGSTVRRIKGDGSPDVARGWRLIISFGIRSIY